MDFVLIVGSIVLGVLLAEKAGFKKSSGALIGLFFNLFGIVYLAVRGRRKNRATATPIAARNAVIENPRKQFSGSRFAQDGAKGNLFSYASTTSGSPIDSDYVVVDLETSGLEPSNARVIEIALKRIDKNGNTLDEYSTLINPGNGDVGATFIHHITEDAVADAPTFAEVSDQIMFRMQDAVMVAHHAAFEDKFLSAEFKRAGLKVAPVPALDTLWLARTTLDLPNFKQDTLLNFYGIQANDAHTALGDVRALSQILPKLVSLSGELLYSDSPWAEITQPPSLIAKTRVSNLKKGDAGWMKSILSKLPDHALEVSSDVERAYLDYLAIAFQDGKLIGDEAKDLAKIAGRAGLGAKQVESLNQRFLDSVIKQAESDGTVSSEEKKLIQQVQINLGLD